MLRRVTILKLKTCLLVVCGFMVAFGQSAQPDNAAKEAISKAQAAYSKKDFALAKRELNNALAVRRDLAEAHLLLGMIAWREGKIGAAIKSVKEAIKYQPHYPEAHYVMGKLHFEKKGWKLAEEEANLALGQAKFGNVYVLLGDLALAQEQYEPAMKFFEQALTQPPPNSEVTNVTRIKMEAVKNLVELRANKRNKDFQTPIIVARGRIPRPILFRKATVKLAGILNEQGRFTPFFVVYLSDERMSEFYLQYATGIEYAPAMKNSAPMPIWFLMEMEFSSYVK